MGMESFVRSFIRSSLVWLGIGVFLGLGMAWWPVEHLVYRPAHAHALLLGFVAMMIFGVAYHVIPRFAGNGLMSRRLAVLHLWLANLGLAGMVAGWVLRGWLGWGTPIMGMGGTVTAVGTVIFIYNIWMTLGPARQSHLVGIGSRPARPAGSAPRSGPPRPQGRTGSRTP